MTILLDLIRRLSVSVCVVCLVAIFATAAAEILSRNLFGYSLYVSIEVCGYLGAVFTVFGAAYCIATGRALSITLVTNLPGIRDHGGVIRLVHAVLGAAVLSFAAYYFYRAMARSYARGTSSGTLLDLPIWIPEFAMMLGLAACALAAALQLAAPKSSGETNDGF